MYVWVEASRTIVYVHNRVSHSSLGNKTSEEMFFKENPDDTVKLSLAEMQVLMKTQLLEIQINIDKMKNMKLSKL